MFKKRPDVSVVTPEAYADLMRRIGALEAQVETLPLQWANYRDELKRLVNRLEKRDQRMRDKEETASAVNSECSEFNGHEDAITAKIKARRAKRGLSQ